MVLLLAAVAPCFASLPPQPLDTLTWNTNNPEPARFVAAHGQQSVIMGYPSTGLEVWAYPLQLVSGYAVAFQPQDSTRVLRGSSLLRRVEYRADGITRIYIGPDFVVREQLFAPLHVPGVMVRYQVTGRGRVAIRVHFLPSLNLMWPGALGGQGIAWSSALSGYTLNEPLYGYTAEILSQQISRHDPVVNRTVPLGEGYAFELAPQPQPGGAAQATVYIGLDAPHTQTGSTAELLQAQEPALRAEMAQHAALVASQAITIETPDEEVNRALAWATLALDQAWVCNPQLGCGEVAGYGPSRPGRRPQYDWFFAGDGLVAVQALLAEGNIARARDELGFIARYQDEKTGMIWHELSQSAGLIDWEHHYPYMFVHVDITFQYLAALAEFLRTSGDIEFLREHWSGIARAYAYCLSTIDPATGLPAIPAGKEGADEQDQLRDELGLSSEWIAAADGYAALAGAVGDAAAAANAAQAADRARRVVAAHSWDANSHYWIAGHTMSGAVVEDQRPEPAGILGQHVFSDAQVYEALDELASAQFQTDWGTRSMSSASPAYDPDSYSKGSVSALATASVAEAFWQQDRPLIAWQIWSALIPWNTLDSMGHLHEVLTGDVYHPQVESVPEQTWSSAGFLRAAVHGLLGLSVDATANTLTFAPRLPVEWHDVSVSNVRVGGAQVRLHLWQQGDDWTLEARNSGSAVTLQFSQLLALGAQLGRVTVNGAAVHASLQTQGEVQTANIQIPLAGHSTTLCRVAFKGGVSVVAPRPAPQLGDPSRMLRLRSARFAHGVLTILADLLPEGGNTVSLVTAWRPLSVSGAQIAQRSPGIYTLRFAAQEGAYPTHARATVRFASR